MARADGNQALEELYRILADTRFDFMPRGESHLRRVYGLVRDRHPNLCDDTYLCSTCCKDGTDSPEWKHVVRGALNNLRKGRGPVSKGASHGYWIFGDLGVVPISEAEIIEGRRLLKLHKVKERKPQIVRRKKRAVLAATGRLVCEACDFDFASVYGKLGEGFAECHHRSPLAELDGETPTRLEDLAIVCANCHRMLHKSRPMLRVENLRTLILQRRSER